MLRLVQSLVFALSYLSFSLVHVVAVYYILVALPPLLLLVVEVVEALVAMIVVVFVMKSRCFVTCIVKRLGHQGLGRP